MLEKAGIRSGSSIMKAAVCCLLVSAFAFAQTPKATYSTETAKLVALERMWNQAQVIRDATAVASMIGDKFINLNGMEKSAIEGSF